MRQPQFHPKKNDFFFALLVAAMFAVTVVGAIVGALDLAGDRVAVNYAQTREAPGALRAAPEKAPQLARAGPGR
jgi:hypothetical protein